MENLNANLNTLLHSMQWFWLGLAILLGILEVGLSTSFFLLWLALVSFVVGIFVWIIPSISLTSQFLIFAIGSLAFTLLWRRYLKNHPIKSDRPHLNRRSEQYIGRTFTLIENIENGRGKIRVDDSTWQVEGPELPVGSKVKVVSANGVILKVEPVRADDSF